MKLPIPRLFNVPPTNVPPICATLFIYSAILILASILTGCNSTTPIKKIPEELATYKTHQELYQSGQKSFEKWGKEFSYSELKNSYDYFKGAIEIQPDNIQYQKAYYLVLFARSILESNITEAQLIKMFNLIHPVVQASIAAPAKSTYIRGKAQKEEPDILIGHLTRAIYQQPYDPYPWLELSSLYEKQHNFWLSAATAKQATALEDSAAAEFKVGTQLNNLAKQKKCSDNWKPYKHQAIKHIASASAKEPDNANYLYSQAYLYQTLGLMPLSLMQVKKSLEIKKGYWPTRLYTQVALSLKKYELAETLSTQLINEYNRHDGYLFKSMSYAGRHQWEAAREALQHYIEKDKPTINHHVIHSWITNLASDQKIYPQLQNLPANTEWEILIKDFFNGETLKTEKDLNYFASNSCERSIGHFYNAYKFWLNADIPSTERQLLDAINYPSLQFTEHYWAEIILHYIQR